MNLVKRAALRLRSTQGQDPDHLVPLPRHLRDGAGRRHAQGRAARAKNDAKRSVRAEVHVQTDLKSPSAGGVPSPPLRSAPRWWTSWAPPRGPSPRTPWFVRGAVQGGTDLVTEGVDAAASGMGPDGTPTVGVLDIRAAARLPQRQVRAPVRSAPHRRRQRQDLLLIEERLARKNGLRTGDKITLGAHEGKATADFTVAGLPGPAPQFRARAGALRQPGQHAVRVRGRVRRTQRPRGRVLAGQAATLLLSDADDLGRFKQEAERIAGSALDGFALDANDKAIRQTTPLDSISSTAAVAMWLIGIAGAAVLALLVNLAVKQRRKEYGVLLAMGEKKGKLIAQQALEIVAVAALAIGLSSLFTQSLTQSAGQSLLGREAAAARHELDSWQPPAPGSTGIDQGIDPDDRPVENADPIDRIDVRLDPAALATVGRVGLGMGLLATALPAASVLRLTPRTILTKGK
ncbi:ABC transporter permease [Streptomyces hirsutus]